MDLLVQLVPHLPGTQAAQHPRPPLPQPSPQGDRVATKSAMLRARYYYYYYYSTASNLSNRLGN